MRTILEERHSRKVKVVARYQRQTVREAGYPLVFFSCLPVLLVQAFPLFPFKLPVILIVFNRIVVNDC